MGDAITITPRWGGPSDASSGSTYKIERNKNGSFEGFEPLVADQAATSPYISPLTTLTGNASYGDTSLTLTSGTSFSSAGYGWIDDALVEWMGKTSDTLTGVIWHSGYGTYAAGSKVVEAHESYVDSSDKDLGAVVYRVTHIDASAVESAPLHVWFFAPPAPASRDHCVVIVQLASDLGMEWKEGVNVQCTLATDNQFSQIAGLHLDQSGSTVNANLLTTNAFGLAFFQCWKSSARVGVAGASDAAYIFELDALDTKKLTVMAAEIPDRDWVLLSQIATA